MALLLGAALQCAHAEGATSQADKLNLGYNQLTDAALPILVEMLKAGAVPCLEVLWLRGNSGISDGAAKKALKAACEEKGQALTLRMQDGYDHSYFFIASFIDDHIAHHAKALLA